MSTLAIAEKINSKQLITKPPVKVSPNSLVKSLPVTATFTDSKGRKTLFRYSFPDGMDLSKAQPLMVYFHGNQRKTKKQVLDIYFRSVEPRAHARGLVAVMIASPDTRDDGARQWDYKKDNILIHEFLTQHLSSIFKPDLNHIYFASASQGTCFMNSFLSERGENYQGGYIAACGCHGNLSPVWNPSQVFVDNMKIYVGSSLRDFQYNTN